MPSPRVSLRSPGRTPLLSRFFPVPLVPTNGHRAVIHSFLAHPRIHPPPPKQWQVRVEGWTDNHLCHIISVPFSALFVATVPLMAMSVCTSEVPSLPPRIISTCKPFAAAFPFLASQGLSFSLLRSPPPPLPHYTILLSSQILEQQYNRSPVSF